MSTRPEDSHVSCLTLTARLLLVSLAAFFALAETGTGASYAQTAPKSREDCTPTFPSSAPRDERTAVEITNVVGAPAAAGGPSEGRANFQMGDALDVEFNNLEALSADSECLQNIDHKPHPIVLYLDGIALSDSIAVLPGPPSENLARFRLEYSSASREAWKPILAKTGVGPGRQVSVSAGVVDQYAVDEGTPITLATLPPGLTYSAAAVVAITLVAFLAAVFRWPSILRESRYDPDKDAVVAGAYSLSRTQAAWWFFLILGSYFFLAVVSGGFSTTFNNTALVLLGIGAATAVGSSMITGSNKQAATEDVKQKLAASKTADDAVKALPSADLAVSDTRLNNLVVDVTAKQSALDAAQAAVTAAPADDTKAADAKRAKANLDAAQQARDTEKKANDALRRALVDQASAATALKDARDRLYAMTAVSENIVKDILSDADGISFHRFQMVVWTIILGGVFVYEVWRTVAMPDFDSQLLWLQGISAGTYLGLKYGEAKTPTGQST